MPNPTFRRWNVKNRAALNVGFYLAFEDDDLRNHSAIPSARNLLSVSRDLASDLTGIAAT
jgi:hypothetical protein